MELQLANHCGCGQVLTVASSEIKKNYSSWGWFCLSFGMTVYPTEVELRCPQCHNIATKITDKNQIQQFLLGQGLV